MVENSESIYFKKIFKKIKKERNLDFSEYRKNILKRRIIFRSRRVGCSNIKEYFAYLQDNHIEIDYLMDAVTINVTEFFRDQQVFALIEKKVIPEIFKRKQTLKSKIIRVWSCGCSSGEEAYSVLMLIAEFLGAALADYTINIYGTDIDLSALAKAREGVYEAEQFKRISKQRKKIIEKYFYNIGNNRYWIREKWPVYMKFQYHDVITDIPLADMDIIFCRNLFIYFNHELQIEITKKFYNSLNKNGYLILGNVECLYGEMRDKFIEYDRYLRIYIKKD